MAGPQRRIAGLDVRRHADGARPDRVPAGPDRSAQCDQSRRSRGGRRPVDILLDGGVSGRGRLRRTGVRLAGRPHGPRPRLGAEHPGLFVVHGGGLLCRHALATRSSAFPGRAGHGRRVVPGRCPGSRMLARQAQAVDGRHHRRRRKPGLRADGRHRHDRRRDPAVLAMDHAGLRLAGGARRADRPADPRVSAMAGVGQPAEQLARCTRSSAPSSAAPPCWASPSLRSP